MPARMLGPEGGWIVRSHISWGGERNVLYKGVEPLSSRQVLKTMRGNPKEKAQRGQGHTDRHKIR